MSTKLKENLDVMVKVTQFVFLVVGLVVAVGVWQAGADATIQGHGQMIEQNQRDVAELRKDFQNYVITNNSNLAKANEGIAVLLERTKKLDQPPR